MPSVLPLVKDPKNIPKDVWDAFLENRKAFSPIGGPGNTPGHFWNWSDTVMDAILSHQLPPEVVERFKAGDGDSHLAKYLLENKHHPELVKPLLQQYFPVHSNGGNDVVSDLNHATWALDVLEKQTNLPADTLQWMHDSYKGKVTRFQHIDKILAKNHNTPPQILTELSQDPRAGLYCDLAKHPNLPQEAKINLLSKPVHPAFHDNLAKDAKPEELDQAIARADSNRANGGIRLISSLLARDEGGGYKNLSEAALDKWSSSPVTHEDFTYAMPDDLKLTPRQAQSLHDAVSYEKSDIHGWLARNSGTPDVVVNQLLQSPFAHARARAAARTSPEHAVAAWNATVGGNDEWLSARTFAEPETNTPPSILHHMALDPSLLHHSSKIFLHPNMTKDHTLELLKQYTTNPIFEQIGEPADRDHRGVPLKHTYIENMLGTGAADERHVQTLLDFYPNVHRDFTPDDMAPYANLQQWKALSQRAVADDPNYGYDWSRAGIKAGHVDNDDVPVNVTFGTNRLRRIRTMADAAGGQIHESQLAKEGIDVRKMGFGKLVAPNGMVTSQSISNHIDSLPSLKYGVTESNYGSGGAQMHHSDEQNVFQLNASAGHLRSMAKEGVLDLYQEMLDSTTGAHPSHGERGLGWVRYNTGKDGQIHIDEIQSDFHEGGQLYRASRHTASNQVKMKKLFKIMWGSKNPTDVLHEAFHQHMRDQGRIGVGVHLWDVDSKHKHTELSGLSKDKPPPVHTTNTYKNYPEKMGYEPAMYGEADAQKNTKYTGAKTLKTTIHKSEKTEDSAVAPVPHQQHKLVAFHNLTQSNLMHAHQMGGIAAPSMGIAHDHQVPDAFGDITLLGDHKLVSPEHGVPVFDADVYSPRYPRVQYHIKEKEATKLMTELRPHAAKTDAYLSDWDSWLHDPKEFDSERTHHKAWPAFASAFLASKGIDFKPVVKVSQGNHHDTMMHPDMQALKASLGQNELEYNTQELCRNPQIRKTITHAAQETAKTIDAKLNAAHPDEPPETLYQDSLKESLETDGLMNYSLAWKMLRELKDAGETVTDKYATHDALRAEIAKHPDFQKWTDDKLNKLRHKPHFIKPGTDPFRPDGSRKVVRGTPYNLDKITEFVTRSIRGAEGFDYGFGSARAMGARQFSSMDELKSHAHRIVSKNDMEQHKKAQETSFNELAQDLARYHPASDSFRFSDAILGAVKGSMKRGKNLYSEMRAEGFKNVPVELVNRLKKFRDDLLDAPTEYFEAKPQRAVRLNEFKSAVVPHNTAQHVLDTLAQLGLSVHKYDSSVEGDRSRAVGEAAHAEKLHLSEEWYIKTEPLVKSTSDIEGWLGAIGVPLQKSLPDNDAYRQIIYRWELPVKVMLGDTWEFPEFQAAKMLAPTRRFNEDKYRESLLFHGDDMIMAAIFAYDLPRDKATYNHIKTLMEMYQ